MNTDPIYELVMWCMVISLLGSVSIVGIAGCIVSLVTKKSYNRRLYEKMFLIDKENYY